MSNHLITVTRDSLEHYTVNGANRVTQGTAHKLILHTLQQAGYPPTPDNEIEVRNGLDAMLIGATVVDEITPKVIEVAPTSEPDNADPNIKRADRGAAALASYAGMSLEEFDGLVDDELNAELSGLLSDLHHFVARHYKLTVSGTIDRMATEKRISSSEYASEVRESPAFANVPTD